MASTNYTDVRAFHEKFGLPIGEIPTNVDLDMGEFRLRFLREELDETARAFLIRDLPGFFDGLLDLTYVAMGTAVIMGLEWHNSFRGLHLFMQIGKNVAIPNMDHTDFMLAYEHARAINVIPTRPAFILPNLNVLETNIALMDSLVSMAETAYFKDDLSAMQAALVSIGYSCMHTAAICGLPWQDGWDAVQAANMAKVRVEREADSKRGSRFDVVKPEGWTAPDLNAILVQHGWP